MRKIGKTIIFILLLVMSASYAVDLSSTTFEIAAYKVGAPYFQITITDAINEDLDVLDNPYTEEGIDTGNYDEINLTEHVEELISESKIIFSYRVVGNLSGKYSIGMTFGSLTDGTNTITSSYGLRNYTEIFQSTSSNTAASGSTTYTIKPGSPSGDSSSSLSYSWEITPSAADGVTIPVWIARGAVAMEINQQSYKAAPLGTYTSLVTVTLTTP